MPKTIYVTQPIPESGLEMLRAAGEVCVGPAGRTATPQELAAQVRGVDAVLCFVGEPIDATVLEAAAPTCRVVANYGVGTDNIDIPTATRLGIQVTNTPNVLTDATADLAFTLLLAVARDLAGAARLAASGTWTGVAPMQLFGHDVAGRTLGIVGAGRIGAAVARRGMGFDMPVVYTSRKGQAALDKAGATRLSLAELLSRADFVSLHVALTPETRGLIGADELARMKRSAYLINTSRGQVVDEAALIRALRDGSIAGAGLDVFAREPHIPPELLAMPNVVCLPHVGSATHETRSRMAVVAARNVIACLRGEAPPNP
ncbi:MAG TPA: D-glycerate dehydrogenase, partial [Phycisphaerae bacterium]|nr:D-glycerate dehydrogenase [Phycisphaerae bacterium]